MTAQNINNDVCGTCKKGQGKRAAKWIQCTKCSVWYHISCAGVSTRQYNQMNDSTEWSCKQCRRNGRMDNNKPIWGQCKGQKSVREKISAVYEAIVKWDKNIMKVPREKVGKNFLNELCRLITLFTEKTIWEPLAFSLVHIFVPLMLQKPSARSKPKENCKYLQSRLEKWEQGNLDNILSECKEIQLRIKKLNKTSESNKRKLFCRLMLEGKIGQASKLIDNANRTGLLPVNEDTIRQLQAKHPPAMKRFKPEVKPSRVEPVIFEAIDSKTVQSMAKKTFGSGGPTLIDADCWKHMLCSRGYASCSDSLAQSIADATKRICTESVNPESLSELLASRLVPLDKCPGIRPIGIGEALRRIMGKCAISKIRRRVYYL
eukprot:gene4395-4983_t